MTPGEAVAALIAANQARDIDAILATLTDDVVYENVPMSVLTGHEEVRGFLGPFADMSTSIEFEVLHQVEQGNVVMNERVDKFVLTDGKKIALRVAGVFEVRDGKIAVWRDYFDVGQFNEQMG